MIVHENEILFAELPVKNRGDHVPIRSSVYRYLANFENCFFPTPESAEKSAYEQYAKGCKEDSFHAVLRNISLIKNNDIRRFKQQTGNIVQVIQNGIHKTFIFKVLIQLLKTSVELV
jgi:hypothetical protein